MRKIFSLLMFVPFIALAQDNDQNWAKQVIYKTAQTVALPNAPAATDAAVNVTYLDGLGRAVQHIAHKQSATGTDIITHMEYDDFGRQAVQYLPYATSRQDNMGFVTDARAETLNYGEYHSQSPFGETAFEASPLNRALMQSAPGTTANWAMGSGHEIRYGYSLNTPADIVREFKVSSDVLIDMGLAAEKTLYKHTTTDENGNQTCRFTNVKGQMVLQRAFDDTDKVDTYYVYDDFGNLSYVIPPKANGTIDAEVIEKLCYFYTYDKYNRLIKKKLPQKQTEYIVYDKLNRIVATGPAADPFGVNDTLVGWLVNRYDALGRVAYTGWYAVSSIEGTYKPLQLQHDGQIENVEKQENNILDSIKMWYTHSNLPAGFLLLTVNYYDDYDFPHGPGVFETGLSPDKNPVYYDAVNKPRGLPTGSWVRILKPGVVAGESSYVLYDRWARPVVHHTDNGDGDAYTVTATGLNFAGEAQQVKTTHKRPGQAQGLEVTEDFSYTDQGRLQTHLHKIGTGNDPAETLSSSTYSGLGRLLRKDVGSNGPDPLQQVDYRYNIRGWLKSINNVHNLFDQGQQDLFAFALSYDQHEHEFEDGKPQYNGNISETYWISRSDNILRQYSYAYDDLKRLRKATYIKDDVVTNAYDEEITYDLNGNIGHIWRNGNLDNIAPPTIETDDLNYAYEQNSNRLIGVYDASHSTEGFKDNPNAFLGERDYDYDDYGNLIQDGNKRIDRITYNHLNLPVEISIRGGKKITYLYNATGAKLQKVVSDPPALVTTDYISGFQYRNNILQFFSTAEGYVATTVIDSVNHYNYVYHYRDHLGNIRLSYGLDEQNEVKILEENHYYPYGLKHTNYNTQRKKYGKAAQADFVELQAVPPSNGLSVNYNYKFNGMEWQDELGLNLYDMDMRDYDPAISRWTGIDPVTHFDQSTYMAMDGNPVYFADPSGADGVSMSGTGGYYLNWAANQAYLNSSTGSSSNWGQSAVGGNAIGFMTAFASSVYTTSTPTGINAIIGYYARQSGFSGYTFTYNDSYNNIHGEGVGFQQYSRKGGAGIFGSLLNSFSSLLDWFNGNQSGYVFNDGSMNSDYIGDKIGKNGVLYGVTQNPWAPGAEVHNFNPTPLLKDFKTFSDIFSNKLEMAGALKDYKNTTSLDIIQDSINNAIFSSYYVIDKNNVHHQAKTRFQRDSLMNKGGIRYYKYE